MTKRDIIFIVLGALLLLVVAILPTQIRRVETLECAQNMAAINTFVKVGMAVDKKDHVPATFLTMSNYIDPSRLICPGDWSRHPAPDWASFTTSNSSYVIIGSVISSTDYDAPYLACLIHTNFFDCVGGLRGFNSDDY